MMKRRRLSVFFSAPPLDQNAARVAGMPVGGQTALQDRRPNSRSISDSFNST